MGLGEGFDRFRSVRHSDNYFIVITQFMLRDKTQLLERGVEAVAASSAMYDNA